MRDYWNEPYPRERGSRPNRRGKEGGELEKVLADHRPVELSDGHFAGAKAQGGDVFDRVLNTMACHGAIKAGKPMTIEEMDTLLEQMKPLKLPSHCPHGRPVFKKLSFYEIERMFKRVV